MTETMEVGRFFAGYLLAAITLAMLLGWPDRRKRKRWHNELVKRGRENGQAGS